MAELVLWVKADCRLCREAEELMASLSAALGFGWRIRHGEYGDRVPVITTTNGDLLAEAPIAPAELARRIRGLNPPDPD